MSHYITLYCWRVFTNITLVWFLTRMDSWMSNQRTLHSWWVFTNITLVWFLPRVDSWMSNQRTLHTLARKESCRDLGKIISQDLKFHKQTSHACKRANAEISRIKRSFISRDRIFLRNMFQIYFRPHLEYCVELWNPTFQGDINKMERVKNRLTRSWSMHMREPLRAVTESWDPLAQAASRTRWSNTCLNISKNKNCSH